MDYKAPKQIPHGTKYLSIRPKTTPTSEKLCKETCWQWIVDPGRLLSSIRRKRLAELSFTFVSICFVLLRCVRIHNYIASPGTVFSLKHTSIIAFPTSPYFPHFFLQANVQCPLEFFLGKGRSSSRVCSLNKLPAVCGVTSIWWYFCAKTILRNASQSFGLHRYFCTIFFVLKS